MLILINIVITSRAIRCLAVWIHSHTAHSHNSMISFSHQFDTNEPTLSCSNDCLPACHLSYVSVSLSAERCVGIISESMPNVSSIWLKCSSTNEYCTHTSSVEREIETEERQREVCIAAEN